MKPHHETIRKPIAPPSKVEKSKKDYNRKEGKKITIESENLWN